MRATEEPGKNNPGFSVSFRFNARHGVVYDNVSYSNNIKIFSMVSPVSYFDVIVYIKTVPKNRKSVTY